MSEPLFAADNAARVIALTALNRTLLVEAGAGSGKTSVLAGRVAALLAAGRPPTEIAAITFTELAAGELRQRVTHFVAELADGYVRPDLHAAFPSGRPDERQRATLLAARDRLDELTCTTIHGFCQRLLRPYPVEAGIDPGATVMDRAAADALLVDTLDAWLRERLSGAPDPDDLLAALYGDDAKRTGTLVRDLLGWMVHHRGAPVPDVQAQSDPLWGLRGAAAALRAFLAAAPCCEEETVAIADALDALLAAAPEGSGSEALALLHAMTMPVPACCATQAGWAAYRKKTKWQAAAKATRSAATAERLNEEAGACYAACVTAHAATRAYAAGRVLHRLAGELRMVLTRFEAAKRQAALIDFDDLMVRARDLLASHPPVRAALAAKHAAVLVDEFQDTDRLQSEILWRLCAEKPDVGLHWTQWALRPGALFLVGDPKQAIYRFRGADVSSYLDARDRLTATDADARLVIGQNFRSYAPILAWVNDRFALPLAAAGQPGFEALFTTVATPDGHAAVVTLPVEVSERGADARRDAEAEAVATFCARIVGALPVRGRAGARPCEPDDIALLAPTGTELWRYERALEAAGLSVSTQAGKGFFRRQEIHDLIALTRTLADARDTLAFGALLRGPLVGLTEEMLLDATAALPPRPDGRPGQLFLWTPLGELSDLVLRETLAILQGLARSASGTTPFVLLCQAVEEMQVRPLLRRRQGGTAERALANIDQFLEAARSWDLRGLPAFARMMAAQWTDAQRTMEGRPDTEQQSVTLMTMHAAKGLEWPVVVPVNLGGGIKEHPFATLDADGRLHLSAFRGPGSDAALAAEREELDRERQRLWYVAATRARDLLVMPTFSTGVPRGSWMERFGLRHEGLHPFDPAPLPPGLLHAPDEAPNTQDHATFKTQAALIAQRSHRITRVTPHLAEAGDAPATLALSLLPGQDDPIAPLPPRGSLARGLVLHKLLEEVLTGELAEDVVALGARATELSDQLDGTAGAATLDPSEVARAALRGLALPEIRAVLDRLVPEYTVSAAEAGPGVERITLGVADAVLRDPDGTISLVVDWKSDVDPSAETVARYHAQVTTYLAACGAREGLLVFLTAGRADRVTHEP